MSDTYTYGEYFNISNCHCLTGYKPSIPNYPETPGWYPQIKPSVKEEEKDTVFTFISNEKFKPEEMPEKCVCASRERLNLAMSDTIYDCIVLVPITDDYLTDENHIINLGTIVSRLKDTHEICLVCPDKTNLKWYKEQYEYTFSEMRYPSEDYDKNPMYDAAMFKQLSEYEYSLCLSLNCMVNGDGNDLATFIEDSYDFIGAPLKEEDAMLHFNMPYEMCGYDEFSLKKNTVAIDICNLMKANKASEDFISYSKFNSTVAKITPISRCRLFAVRYSDKDFWLERNKNTEPFGFIYNI